MQRLWDALIYEVCLLCLPIQMQTERKTCVFIPAKQPISNKLPRPDHLCKCITGHGRARTGQQYYSNRRIRGLTDNGRPIARNCQLPHGNGYDRWVALICCGYIFTT